MSIGQLPVAPDLDFNLIGPAGSTMLLELVNGKIQPLKPSI